jgi:hypothetical protein
MDNINKRIAACFRKERGAYHLTAAAVAIEADMSPDEYRAIEAPQAFNLSIVQYIKICNVLGLEPGKTLAHILHQERAGEPID